jgi:hypothetical protein
MPVQASAISQDDIIYILEAESLGGYSEITDRDGEFSTMNKWLFSPTLRMSDSLHWINVYNGSYNRSAQVVAVEEGGRETQTTQAHHLSSAFKYDVNETWTLRPILFADWIFVNETEDEDFGDGLYDYRDLGAGLESQWTTLKTDTQENDVRLGFRYIDREYPNYRSLLSLFNPNGAVETNEKDLQGYKTNLGYRSRSRDDWSWGVEGIFFYKDYTDKKTIDRNGILQAGDTREDFVEYLNVFASHPVNEDWTFGIDGQFAHSDSNLDFYDTHNTATLVDDNFVKDYFDYFSFLVRPSFTYNKLWDKDRNFSFTVDYSFYALHYPGRKAQNQAGAYQADDQQDYQHTVSGRVSVPINKYFSWVTYGSYTTAESNQEFESFYLYEYDLWTAVTGISFKY